MRLFSLMMTMIFVFGVSSLIKADGPNWKSSAPTTVTPPTFEQTEAGELSIDHSDSFSYGQWNGEFMVSPRKGCRVQAEAIYPVEPLPKDNKVMVILSWYTADSVKPLVQRDYLDFTETTDGVRKFDETFNVPKDVVRLVVECVFKWQQGKAIFRNIKVEQTAALPPRQIRVAALKTVPPGGTIENNLAALEKTLLSVCRSNDKFDIILCSECFTNCGVNAPLEETAEAVPGGPTYNLISRFAKEYKTYIVGNVYEKTSEGRYLNTAFILDREGKLVGCYRKVHLPMTEAASGVVPGEDYPVFDLDFGRVGILICWDNWFVESARQLRLNGAELLLFPLAGDGKKSHWSIVWPTRAIDNSIPLVVSTWGVNAPSAILDRDGEWLAMTFDRTGYVSAVIDLAERKRSYWLSVGPCDGDPYQLYIKERRPGTYQHFQKP